LRQPSACVLGLCRRRHLRSFARRGSSAYRCVLRVHAQRPWSVGGPSRRCSHWRCPDAPSSIVGVLASRVC
jgi:hypothetical protein